MFHFLSIYHRRWPKISRYVHLYIETIVIYFYYLKLLILKIFWFPLFLIPHFIQYLTIVWVIREAVMPNALRLVRQAKLGASYKVSRTLNHRQVFIG